jgi:hypothetical protein
MQMIGTQIASSGGIVLNELLYNAVKHEYYRSFGAVFELGEGGTRYDSKQLN